VATAAATITGSASVCTGQTITLANTTTGGKWTSSAVSKATVDSVSGVVTGVASGTATISYNTGCGTVQTKLITVLASPSAITGSATACTGLTTTLSDATTAGTWASSNTSVASINTSGVVTPGVAGTATISYTKTGCTVTKALSVYTNPSAITGATSVCAGSATTLADGVAGWTWSATNGSGSATVNSSTGIVTGTAAGSVTVSYTIGGACRSTAAVTVLALPATITGTTTAVCVGATTTYSSTTTGGVWSTSNSAVATVSVGTVTGVTAGSATITYTAAGCYQTKAVTVNITPTAISGASSVCNGASVTLTDAVSGGTWSRTNGTGTATITTGGVITGAGAGSVTVSYTIGSCKVTLPFTVNAMPAAITGNTSLCVGSGTTLSNTVAGGTWSSSASAKATINASGMVTGVAGGTTNISYTIGTCAVGRTDTVKTAPGPITGLSAMCAGATATFTDTVSGGTWTSLHTAFATVNSAGLVTAVAAGIDTITYSTGCGTATIKPVTVSGPGLNPITVSSTVCNGSATTYTTTSTGGAWSSNATSVATVSAGLVTGHAAGIAVISYTSGSCYVTKAITVIGIPSTITGGSSVCVGGSDTLFNTVTGGTWTSGATGVATIDPSSGILSGLSAGTTLITYSTGCSPQATLSYTVNAQPGAITGASNLCTGIATTLSNGLGSGTWSSANTAVANINASTGAVTGVASGNTTIIYAVGSCSSTYPVTVFRTPSAIIGTLPVCTGSSVTLSDTTVGGIWSSSDTLKANVNSALGIVNILDSGNVTIFYTTSNCSASTSTTVSKQPSSIGGVVAICAGSLISLTDSVSGGTWTSSNTGVATVSSPSGIVSGIAAGSSYISYTVGTCFSASLLNLNISPTPITGTNIACTS